MQKSLTLSTWGFTKMLPIHFHSGFMQSREKHMWVGRVGGREFRCPGEGRWTWVISGLFYWSDLSNWKLGFCTLTGRRKLIKSQRDRRLRTLCSTPFVRDSICTLTFHQTFFLFHSPLSELSSWESMEGKTWQPTVAGAHHYGYCDGEGTADRFDSAAKLCPYSLILGYSKF